MADLHPYAFQENMDRLSTEIWSVTEQMTMIAGLEGEDRERERLDETLRKACDEMILSVRTALYNLRADDIAIDLEEMFNKRKKKENSATRVFTRRPICLHPLT